MIFFVALYALIAVHYVSFDRAKGEQCLQKLAREIKDVRLSSSFKSKAYAEFVYDK
ncbi:hypothetical protein [uncultured Campylobacter sp.]|uniref:hypothetical protein n=1 Tax=uncultured Campylobacter sp. TaxID=218934 RepID=UPI00261E0CE5|nr:hypothetical protein [uncultured Campylobacter sp.]